jgi:hypothetical protein
VSTTLDERRQAAATKLLPLLTREEREELAARLGVELPEGLKPKEEIDAIAPSLRRLPRHRVLAELLDVAASLATMLSDIVSFLERHGVAARTTGFALRLGHPTPGPGSITVDLSPQEVGAICSWSPKTLRKLGDDPFEEAARAWRLLRPGWDALLDRGSTRVESGDVDWIETAIAHHRSTIEGRLDYEPLKYEPDRDDTDYAAQDVLRHLLERVEQTVGALRRIAPAERSASVHQLIRALDQLLAHGRHALRGAPRRTRRRQGPSAERALEKTLASYRRQRFPRRGFFDDFDRFEEDIWALADLEEAGAFLDALRLDLWSNRPQLFEVWVLVAILDWLERRGYDVELLMVETSSKGRPVWQLKYAGGSKPCARVTGNGRSEFVFYQLFRPRTASGKGGAMPDLALLRGDSPDAERVWAIDPKLSETYSPSAYEETARRYLTDFGAPLAIVVEYFRRTAENPRRLSDGAWLVTDVSPDGSGLPYVLDAIAASHPPQKRTLVCVDMSSSFEARRPQALRAAVAGLAGQSDAVADEYVCFAGDAEARTGFHDFVRSGDTPDLAAPQLSPGTALEPLIEKLREVIERHGPMRVEVIGDGEFGESDWIARLETALDVDVRLRA